MMPTKGSVGEQEVVVQNDKAACGRHKEEILSQLHELAKSKPLDLDNEQQQYLQSGNMSKDPEHDFKTDIFPYYEPCSMEFATGGKIFFLWGMCMMASSFYFFG
ncbi:hypothetical protein PIB30_005312 [Stylosanthes scabra]|uniref:Uncharacterized protein n=1 Tax=Stylosanthes scabra TaxID=79078 RepID=A0ABU6U2R4_9FABA|nr:hypothetical protein [Stylosanthes scabra]